jgi:hypothetical protein
MRVRRAAVTLTPDAVDGRNVQVFCLFRDNRAEEQRPSKRCERAVSKACAAPYFAAIVLENGYDDVEWTIVGVWAKAKPKLKSSHTPRSTEQLSGVPIALTSE